MLDVVASSPSTARSSTDFSDSREVWKAVEEDLSRVARERRESVRVSCSRRLEERACSVVWVWLGVVGVGSGAWVDVGGAVGWG